MRTIILAGGFGTRLLPITAHRAKPLLPVAGKPIIDHVLANDHLGDGAIVSVNRRFAKQFEAWRESSDWDVELLVEETRHEREKLGTIGAIAFVIERCEIDEDILVIGGDNLFGFEIAEFIAAFRGHVLIALHDLLHPEAAKGRYGVAVVEDGKVKGFQEKPEHPRSTLASTACYIYPREALPRFQEYYSWSKPDADAPGYFNEWGLEHLGWDIDAFVFDSHWFDVGDRESYLAANRQYSGHDIWYGPKAVQKESTVQDCIFLGDSLIVNSDLRGCVVDTGCQLTGVTLRECLVGSGSKLTGSRSPQVAGDERALAEAERGKR
jgi:glucose-1-phosphate thymidylyltransferase